ncbi:MOSC N-terminal beta barrel domain-containing protein [Poronia punctata]|nr:MOSC N-terminal beta barrel domain-containing protein [Poronia punctata]
MEADKPTAYNSRIEAIREEEFPMINDNIYLDHAGTTLYPKSLMDSFAAEMTANLFGNPHSASASSQDTMSRIENIRHRVLEFFNADPAEFDVVFVANATAGIKLVGDAFRGSPHGFDYYYHRACHTSLVGVRQEAQNSVCFDSKDAERWIKDDAPAMNTEPQLRPTLLAYPAQSNMDGRRCPLTWCQKLRESGLNKGLRPYVLLDAAAYASTSPLDLGNVETAPDFAVLSFYKIFGFPDLGALIVRRQAASVFQQRRYFGGGTVDMVVCSREHWHARKTQSLHESLEDGTLPIHNIIALGSALDIHQKLYGSMAEVASHTVYLTRRLRKGLESLRHGNDKPVCVIYSAATDDPLGSGPVLAFNLQSHLGAWISLSEFEKLAVLKKFHIRTGGLCNPGGVAAALGLEPWEMKENFSAGFRCGNENDIINGKPTGVIRVSLGAMSTASDVDRFIAFIEEFYRETRQDIPEPLTNISIQGSSNTSEIRVETIMVYPIKSCGGFRVPPGTPWGIRPEGLAWDREWCLINLTTGLALSQKRYPRMALIRPSIDFETGQLKISYHNDTTISVPLSVNPELFQPLDTLRSTSRVCGDEVSMKIYKSKDLDAFFSDILGVPCALARFPPGGSGGKKSIRHAKAHLTPDIHTPPDSDTESTNNRRQRILLSNESPILAINLSSLSLLNAEIVKNGGVPVSADAFRANIVLSSTSTTAYAEDYWDTLQIGPQSFKILGPCRRCHMVCIDQETAVKSEEPFVTLARTRRFEGKVFFGAHMCHLPVSTVPGSRESQFPTISVGDRVVVDG